MNWAGLAPSAVSHKVMSSAAGLKATSFLLRRWVRGIFAVHVRIMDKSVSVLLS